MIDLDDVEMETFTKYSMVRTATMAELMYELRSARARIAELESEVVRLQDGIDAISALHNAALKELEEKP